MSNYIKLGSIIQYYRMCIYMLKNIKIKGVFVLVWVAYKKFYFERESRETK